MSGDGPPGERPLSYGDAGVSLEAADAVVERIRAAVTSTHTDDVLAGVGAFAGVFLPTAADPFVAASCDGVGTKVLLAQAAGRLRGIGVDLVAMSVNDVITTGARAAFFLDYIACSRIDGDVVVELVEGVADGCREAGCVLLGGETAEHGDAMEEGRIDLAGFCVGVGERRATIGGARIKAGDAILGVASSGVHANGFSLVRRLLDRAGLGPDDRPDGLGGAAVADALLEPTRIYARGIRALTATVDVRGMAHITGGGIPGNLARSFPPGLGAAVDLSSWERPAVFGWLAGLGVDEDEMRRVFNLGLGFAAVVPADGAELALRTLERQGYDAWHAGEVVAEPGVVLR